MLIKLNPSNRRCNSYEPPIPVTRHFEDIDPDASYADKVDQLLWIPAIIVSRFSAQFPALHNELDELFSIGVVTVCEVVDSGKHTSSKIGAVVHVSCVRAMEDYANNINSLVKISTTTRYAHLRDAVETPRHQRMAFDMTESYDDQTELLVRDAAELLGFDITALTTKQKRRLWEVLS